MPLYEYECESCAQRFERIQKFSDPPIETCPSCAGRVKKLLSSPAIQFKGSGWYITDYAKKSGESAKPSGDAAKKTETSGDKPSGSSSTDSAASAPAKTDTKAKTE